MNGSRGTNGIHNAYVRYGSRFPSTVRCNLDRISFFQSNSSFNSPGHTHRQSPTGRDWDWEAGGVLSLQP